MRTIIRDPLLAAKTTYDCIVVGAGIYGISLALQASRMGLSCLLLEKNDFGGATTFNHLRTVHGGLRYLQSLDLRRFFESVGERSWFLREFPGLATPLPCLMPLYGNGPYRPSIFRVALALNDLLSWNRNREVAPGQELPAGRVVDAATVFRLFPQIDRQGLQGGAIWHDGGLASPQLLVMEMLKRACAAGATALNYLEAQELLTEEGQVRGIRGMDHEHGQRIEFLGNVVINAAGPCCRAFAAGFDQDRPELFRASIAWNVLFNRTSLAAHSLAIRPKRPNSRMYFVHGFNGLLMGGTIHAPWNGGSDPMPTPEEVGAFIDDLNLTVPGLALQPADVLQIYPGLLPAREEGSARLAVREIIHNHGATGGPQGVYSVSGVKFTTARLVAEKTLRMIFPERRPVAQPDQVWDTGTSDGHFPFAWLPQAADTNWPERLRGIIHREAVCHLDDLLLRRTSLGDNPLRAAAIALDIARLFDWEAPRRTEEVLRLLDFFRKRTIMPELFSVEALDRPLP